MSVTVTIDKAGRIVLPKPMRDELQLAAGDSLELNLEGDQVTMSPRRVASRLQKEQGIWVLRTGVPMSEAEARETLRKIREQRDERNAGGFK